MDIGVGARPVDDEHVLPVRDVDTLVTDVETTAFAIDMLSSAFSLVPPLKRCHDVHHILIQIRADVGNGAG